MNEFSNPIKIIPESKIDLHATVRYRDIEGLFPICIWGLPEVITDEMREGLQGFVCLCLQPYRSMWEHYQVQIADKRGGQR